MPVPAPAPVLLSLALTLSLLACGTRLNEAQQHEYDGLKTRQAKAAQKVDAVKARGEALFRDAGAQERSHRAVTDDAVLCGTAAEGGDLEFGPLPLDARKGWSVRVAPSGGKKGAGSGCRAARATVQR
jgi:hypothetical protein